MCDNANMRTKGDDAHLKEALGEIGVDAATSPECSPELNPIELVFNVIVMRFNSLFVCSEIKDNKDASNILNDAIDSIAPDVMFSCCEKCRCTDFD